MYLTELCHFYDRMAEDPASGMPPEGMSSEQIGFVLVIDAEGNLVGEPWDLRDSSGRSARMFVPAAVKRSGKNFLPNFLWDNTGYVLGVDDKGKADNAAKTAEAFRRFHKELLTDCEDIHAKALLAFLDKWTPEQVENLAVKEALLGANVVFQLKGDAKYLHQHSSLKERWLAHLEKGGKGEKGVCLVTGRQGRIALTHPAIKGVVGSQTSGAALISFHLAAFKSYGKEQNANAPVCESAARSYTSALNYLLQREHRQTVRIGDTCMVFWAERATPAEKILGEFFDIPASDAPQDREQVDKIKGILTALRKGQPLNGVVEDLDGNVRFFVLGLAPNAARLSVRFWLTNTLEVLLRHFSRWYAELHIERQFPASEPEYPPLWLLLVRAVAALGKTENLPPELGGQLASCVLTGRRFPESVYVALLQRIHADKKVDYFRASLIKAYFCRNEKQGENEMETLNSDESNIGYRLGRLFALLEKAQRDALGGDLNASLRDRYIGAASATPRVVFPLLLRLAQHHVTKAKKSGSPKYEAFFGRKLEEIMAGMTDFPAVLSLQDQGRFMLGYYHQNNAFFQKKNTSEETEA